MAGRRTRPHALASWAAAGAPVLIVIGMLLGSRLPARAQPRERASAVPVGVPITVCEAKGDQMFPKISGDIVVWTDYRSNPKCKAEYSQRERCDSDIYGCDLRTKREFPVCTAHGAKAAPAIDGNVVVWSDYRDDSDGRATHDGTDNPDIYGYDLTAKREFPICTASGPQGHPAVSGDLVVWEDMRNYAATGSDIWGRSLAGGGEFPICTARGDQWLPAVSGTLVVWMDFRNDPNQGWDYPRPPDENCDVYGRDLSGGPEITVCTNPFHQEHPVVSGKTVVWQDYRSVSPGAKEGNYDLYGYDLAEKREFSVATALGEQIYPSLSGDLVVWRDYRPGQPVRAIVKNLATGEETDVAGNGPDWPAISGRTVVWDAVWSASRGTDIFAYRLPPSAAEVTGRVTRGQAAAAARGKVERRQE